MVTVEKKRRKEFQRYKKSKRRNAKGGGEKGWKQEYKDAERGRRNGRQQGKGMREIEDDGTVRDIWIYSTVPFSPFSPRDTKASAPLGFCMARGSERVPCDSILKTLFVSFCPRLCFAWVGRREQTTRGSSIGFSGYVTLDLHMPQHWFYRSIVFCNMRVHFFCPWPVLREREREQDTQSLSKGFAGYVTLDLHMPRHRFDGLIAFCNICFHLVRLCFLSPPFGVSRMEGKAARSEAYLLVLRFC